MPETEENTFFLSEIPDYVERPSAEVRLMFMRGCGSNLTRETNPHLLARTHSGLWRSCLDVSQEEYRESLLPSLPWLGERCLSHQDRQTVLDYHNRSVHQPNHCSNCQRGIK